MNANFGWDWIGYEAGKAIVASVIDSDWKANPSAVYVCGSYGEPHVDQFSGCGPSTALYKFKALLVDGVVYIPNPDTRGDDRPEARQWVKAPVQPPSYAVRRVA